MSEEEMIEYLVSTGLYKDTKSDLFYEKRMINTNKTIPISELIERFISVDKKYGGGLWNIKQILSNIDIIIPIEDRWQRTFGGVQDVINSTYIQIRNNSKWKREVNSVTQRNTIFIFTLQNPLFTRRVHAY